MSTGAPELEPLDHQARRAPRRVDLDTLRALGGEPDQVRRAATLRPDDLRDFVRWYARHVAQVDA